MAIATVAIQVPIFQRTCELASAQGFPSSFALSFVVHHDKSLSKRPTPSYGVSRRNGAPIPRGTSGIFMGPVISNGKILTYIPLPKRQRGEAKNDPYQTCHA